MDSSFVQDPTPSQQQKLAASLEGQVIGGKYRVEELIGVGGMGVVVSALHLDLDRRVAIKLIRDELTRDPSTQQRFLQEARSAAKMTNEHVCRVLDAGKLDHGAPFIVMELLEGCDLGGILRERGRIEPRDSVDWILQACEGVAEAHSLGIVHRDLKPDNLFMARFGDGTSCVKVLDFGISKLSGARTDGALTAPHTLMGSPRYMAPEQMLFCAADERSDIWAIGTILYELTSGTPAYAGDSVASICARVIHESPVAPRARAPEVPAELERVILRCLEREPDARYSNVAELAADLAPLGSAAAMESSRKIAATLGSPVPGSESGAPSRLAVGVTFPSVQAASARRLRLRRLGGWVAACGLGLGGLGGAWVALRRAPPPDRGAAAGAPELPASAAPSGLAPVAPSSSAQVLEAASASPPSAAAEPGAATAEVAPLADPPASPPAEAARAPEAATPEPALEPKPAAASGSASVASAAAPAPAARKPRVAERQPVKAVQPSVRLPGPGVAAGARRGTDARFGGRE